jgi:hypothetical protein
VLCVTPDLTEVGLRVSPEKFLGYVYMLKIARAHVMFSSIEEFGSCSIRAGLRHDFAHADGLKRSFKLLSA